MALTAAPSAGRTAHRPPLGIDPPLGEPALGIDPPVGRNPPPGSEPPPVPPNPPREALAGPALGFDPVWALATAFR